MPPLGHLLVQTQTAHSTAFRNARFTLDIAKNVKLTVLDATGDVNENERLFRQILHETREKAGHVLGATRQAAREEVERQNVILH